MNRFEISIDADCYEQGRSALVLLSAFFLLLPAMMFAAVDVSGTDSLRYVMKADSLIDGDCINSNSGCTYMFVSRPIFDKEQGLVSDSISAAILGWLAWEGPDGAPGRNLESIMENFLAAYKEMESEYPEYSIPWASDNTIEVTANRSNIICIRMFAYTFTGGAHPNSMCNFALFDRSNGSRILLTDLFGEEDLQAVTVLAEDKFREIKELAPDDNLEKAGYWFDDGKFRLTPNIGLTEGSIIFYYNSYEIAAYVHGPTELEIPFSKLDQHVPDGSPLRAFITGQH